MTDLVCPQCGEDLDEIGCEKTVVCLGCGVEWKYAKGMERLEEVKLDDGIYADR